MAEELTRRASAVVRILEEALSGRKPQGHKIPQILAAHGWPNRDAVDEQIVQLKRLGEFPVTFDIDEDAPRVDLTRPAAPTPAPSRPAAPRPPAPRAPLTDRFDPSTATVTALLAAAADSPNPKVQAAGRAVTEKVDTLRTLLAFDQEDQARRAEIERLEARLAELRKGAPSKGARGGSVPCPECGKPCANGTGLASHRRSAHPDSVEQAAS